jgi:formyltetrahydrofolate deformylase
MGDCGLNGVALAQQRAPAAAKAVDRQPAPTNRAALIGANATDVLAVVTRFFAEHGICAGEAPHFADPETGRFFLRLAFDMPPGALERLRHIFAPVAAGLRMEWTICDAAARQRTLIMLSRGDHCASELLQRCQAGLLAVDVRAVVSNHQNAAALAHAHGVPFYHLPVTADTQRQQEAQLEALIDDLSIDLVVLARYMRILPPHLCKRLHGRCINIL